MRELILVFFLFIKSAACAAGLPFGFPPAIARLQAEDRGELRDVCDLLTNPHRITQKRKKELISFSRDICESLEYELDRTLDSGRALPAESASAYALLRALKEAFLAKVAAQAGVSPFDLLKMGIFHDLSPWLLRVDRADKGVRTAPDESLLWAPVAGDRVDRFEKLLHERGAKLDFQYVVLTGVSGIGSAPKAEVSDLKKRRWLLKWGDEVHSDPVASRIFAALGYDVDLPQYVPGGALKLVFGKNRQKIRTVQEFVRAVHTAYGINLSPFIAAWGRISWVDAEREPELRKFVGHIYVSFRECSIEARPESQLRVGPAPFDLPELRPFRSLRAAGLLLAWLGVWDTKEDSVELVLHRQDGRWTPKLAYVDLGISFGAKVTKFPRDIKAAHAPSFAPELMDPSTERIALRHRMNFIPKVYREANASDWRWLAGEIARLGRRDLERILAHSGWPEPYRRLYLSRLLARRKNILESFGVADPFLDSVAPEPLPAELDQAAEGHPEGLMSDTGRFRNFGYN